MTIKNIVFDIGNVMVKWEPYKIISECLPHVDPNVFYNQIKPIWWDVNLGKCTYIEAAQLIAQATNIVQSDIDHLMDRLITSQLPLPGSFELLKELYELNVPLYALTDNAKQIIEFYHTKYDFLNYFNDVVVSANVGVLKPDKEIYNYLLNHNKLKAEECVFFDDLMLNVEGAKAVGIDAYQFTSAEACRKQLIELGFELHQTDYLPNTISE